MTSKRSSVLLLFSFLYLMFLALFLAFAALWICDGYYPVGWGWRGAGLHLVFWAMPLCVVAGSFMASFAMNRRVATALLLIGSLPLVVAIFWLEFENVFSKNPGGHAQWNQLRLIAAILVLIAVATLISQTPKAWRFSQGGSD